MWDFCFSNRIPAQYRKTYVSEQVTYAVQLGFSEICCIVNHCGLISMLQNMGVSATVLSNCYKFLFDLRQRVVWSVGLQPSWFRSCMDCHIHGCRSSLIHSMLPLRCLVGTLPIFHLHWLSHNTCCCYSELYQTDLLGPPSWINSDV